ncbi:MAG: hypothetical protein GX879_00025 [Bacteroidales bacterium]|nr:hypothetical protein [Bacteroidales bacterium]
MRKLVLLIFVVLFVFSCGRKISHEEKMFYEFFKEKAELSGLNPDDLIVEVLEIEKIGEVQLADSLQILKDELQSYIPRNLEQNSSENLGFEDLIQVLEQNIYHYDSIKSFYHEQFLEARKSGEYLLEMESEEQSNRANENVLLNTKALNDVEALHLKYNDLAKRTDSVLAYKYKLIYSVKSLSDRTKSDTYNKILYTNSSETAFVKELDILEFE